MELEMEWDWILDQYSVLRQWRGKEALNPNRGRAYGPLAPLNLRPPKPSESR